MRLVIRAEFRRLLATRMWAVALVVAALLGGGLLGALALGGPENFTPPMPGLDTETGVRSVLGIVGFTAFVPAALGTVAITSEYRHRTIAVTFLFAPRRWQVLTAKLVAYGVAGTAYGIVLAGTAALGLFGAAAVRGVTLGMPVGTVLGLLARMGLAMVAYLLLGVAVGALLRNQIAALAVVVGYLYLGETLLMMIPGVNLAYPFLPGGATAALSNYTYLADAMAEQLATRPVQLLSPVAGALLMLAYTLVASAVAVLVPLRRDVT
ncbi:ABC transporter permease subunit [Micromonospora eburnea]|uniref:ABC-type transport system involved in multi-copper enzyme maturation, permease component n=1 Tax=Micromonospora eburnea TaxID=227316 RepID=A0A1C6URL5_9ACTN|nr:ABC transporter permease subunit [Micromonospora eburnea]SCL56580.1 ABC-type transport system involved in multi-copper enzyme maturation, permease component [Micromonospora eburnea]